MFCIISLIIMYQNGSDHYCLYVTVAATETFVSRNVLCVCVSSQLQGDPGVWKKP